MSFVGGGSVAMGNKYLFIDGAYFREVIKGISERYFPGEIMELDFNKVTTDFQKTFYYDCPPGRKGGESEEEYQTAVTHQKDFFNKLRFVSGLHVYEGSIRGEGKRTRQKEIDTLIAVDMLTHSHRKNCSEMTLLAGDLDFKPLVDALVQDGMYVRLRYEKQSASQDLILAVDAREPIDVQILWNLAYSDFQRMHNLPHALSTPADDQIPGSVPVKKGELMGGASIELHQPGDGYYYFVMSDTANVGYKIYVKDKRLELLQKYFEDRYGTFQWLN